jgi:hypothetical protein
MSSRRLSEWRAVRRRSPAKCRRIQSGLSEVGSATPQQCSPLATTCSVPPLPRAWAPRREELCDPCLCPDAPEDNDQRCDRCPLGRLDAAQCAEKGLLLRRAVDLMGALKLGVHIGLAEVPADKFLPCLSLPMSGICMTVRGRDDRGKPPAERLPASTA